MGGVHCSSRPRVREEVTWELTNVLSSRADGFCGRRIRNRSTSALPSRFLGTCDSLCLYTHRMLPEDSADA